jgi:hypothetical protein
MALTKSELFEVLGTFTPEEKVTLVAALSPDVIRKEKEEEYRLLSNAIQARLGEILGEIQTAAPTDVFALVVPKAADVLKVL